MFDSFKRFAAVIAVSGGLLLASGGVASADHEEYGDVNNQVIEQIGTASGLVAVNNVAVPVNVDDVVDVEDNNVAAAVLGLVGIADQG